MGFPLKLPTRIASPPSVRGLRGLSPNTISGRAVTHLVLQMADAAWCTGAGYKQTTFIIACGLRQN
ncbi:MAG: hypothetical protein FRX49_06774 [Trebouxia sp. A1-2]|nr:MAG: hypothetical protein FRX49_06774 [Trebouxia sp. A1-2]